MASQLQILAGTIVDDATVGTVAWSNPNNAKVSDDVYATTAQTTVSTTHRLKATNFGFSIPTGATINGIKVEIQGYTTSDGGSYTQVNRLLKNNSVAGSTPSPNNQLPVNSAAYVTQGGATSLWGTTWTPDDINNSGFGYATYKQLLGIGTYYNTYIDHIRITVYYTEAVTNTGNMLEVF